MCQCVFRFLYLMYVRLKYKRVLLIIMHHQQKEPKRIESSTALKMTRSEKNEFSFEKRVHFVHFDFYSSADNAHLYLWGET